MENLSVSVFEGVRSINSRSEGPQGSPRRERESLHCRTPGKTTAQKTETASGEDEGDEPIPSDPDFPKEPGPGASFFEVQAYISKLIQYSLAKRAYDLSQVPGVSSKPGGANTQAGRH